MQLMPATARQYGVRNAYKEAANLDAGVRHLKTLLDRFAVREAIAAYNAGEAAVRRFGGVPPFRETRAYVERVLALAGLDAAEELERPPTPTAPAPDESYLRRRTRRSPPGPSCAAGRRPAGAPAANGQWTSGILAPVRARGNQLTGNVLGLDCRLPPGFGRRPRPAPRVDGSHGVPVPPRNRARTGRRGRLRRRRRGRAAA